MGFRPKCPFWWRATFAAKSPAATDSFHVSKGSGQSSLRCHAFQQFWLYNHRGVIRCLTLKKGHSRLPCFCHQDQTKDVSCFMAPATTISDISTANHSFSHGPFSSPAPNRILFWKGWWRGWLTGPHQNGWFHAELAQSCTLLDMNVSLTIIISTSTMKNPCPKFPMISHMKLAHAAQVDLVDNVVYVGVTTH